MDNFQVETPIVLLIFNRAETLQAVLGAVRRVQPRVLFVVADGPRANRIGEKEKCDAARAVIKSVDWDCRVLMNYSDVNLGVRRRVSSGLDWVFHQVEEAIVLEDDCLPHPTFFRFAQELLERYRDQEQIGQISGANFQFGRKRARASYYFSHFPHTWGWATWRRAWQNYDVEMKAWSAVGGEDFLRRIVKENHAIEYWQRIFQSMYDGEIDTWDYPWLFLHWVKGYLAVTPNANLVTNIGFRSDATHTQGDSPYADIPLGRMCFPLSHPAVIARHESADRFTQNSHYTPTRPFRVEGKLFRIFVRDLPRRFVQGRESVG